MARGSNSRAGIFDCADDMKQKTKRGKSMMRVMKKLRLGCLFATLGVFALCGNGFAYEVNDKLCTGGIIACEWQYQSISDAP